MDRVLLGVGCLTSVVLGHFEVVESKIVRCDRVLGNSVIISLCNFCLPSRDDCFAIDCVCVMTFDVTSNDFDLDGDVKKNSRVVSKLHAKIVAKDTFIVRLKWLESEQSRAIVFQVSLSWTTCIKHVIQDTTVVVILSIHFMSEKACKIYFGDLVSVEWVEHNPLKLSDRALGTGWQNLYWKRKVLPNKIWVRFK